MVQGHWNLGADGTPASDCYVQVRMSAYGLLAAMIGCCSFLSIPLLSLLMMMAMKIW